MVMNYDGAQEGGAPAATGALPAGTVIGGRFQIEALVGAGGLGHLYRSLDTKTQKPIAIRILAPDIAADEPTLDRLREQVKAASALQHKNVASIFGMGKEGHLRYIALEFVEGQSLRVLLDKKRRGGRTFSLKGAYNVLAHICNALQQAHQTMVHGLPGPGAILINKTGRVKLCEFGVTRALHPATAVRLGDGYCLSPEMQQDPSSAGPSSDIYSLGVVVYELLTGRPPGPRPVPPSSIIPGLPHDVDEVLEHCLAPEPGARFADPSQLKTAFYAAVQGASDQADVEGVVDVSGPPPARPAPAAPGAAPAAPRPAAAAPAAPAPAPGPALMQQRTGPAVAMPARPASGPSGPLTPQRTGPAIGAPMMEAAAPAARPGMTIEDHLAAAEGETIERWLVHKDRLDFGPFTTPDLMRAMAKGEFGGDDMVLDQEGGDRGRIRANPRFREFAMLCDRALQAEKMVKEEQALNRADKKRRTTIIIVVTIGLAVLGAGGGVGAYYYLRKPTTIEKLVYKDKESGPKLGGIDINWKKEPEDQAARRRKGFKKRAKKGVGGGADDDVTYLGDATKEGGDALLGQAAIERVMKSNFNKLVPCVYEEMRRSPGLKNINIDFGVRGSGSVSSVTVNGQSGGPFAGCILSRMQRISFPKFDGTLTRASFSMSLK